MKKLSFALAVLGALSATSAVANNGSGTVEIRGKVVDQTCTVSTNHKNLVVILPTVSKADLAEAGQTAGRKDFQIEVQGCGKTATQNGISTIYAAFSAPSPSYVDNVNAGTLLNRVQGGASTFTKANHVNIQLLDKDGNAIDLSGKTLGSSTAGGATTPTGATHPLAEQGNKFFYETNDPLVAQGKKVDGNKGDAVLGKKLSGGESVYGDPSRSGAGAAAEGAKENYTLQYAAQYYATGTATAGDVEAFVTYNIAYK